MMNTTTTTTQAKEVHTDKRSTEFRHFFIDQLKDIYWAEKHMEKGLGKMCKAATSPRLAEAFEKHRGESDRQIEMLEQVFELMGAKAQGKKCEAMAGLLEEAEQMIGDTDRDTFVRDAGLILAAQKIEHYEIATYGTLRTLAGYLPERKIQRLLEEILKNEKQTDQKLTDIAEKFVNECAAQE